MPSLALIFHLIEAAGEGVSGRKYTKYTDISECGQEIFSQVSDNAVRLAAMWCDYLEQHARKIYAAEVCPGMEAGWLLAQKVEEGEVKDGDTVSLISNRHHWVGLDTPAAVKNAVRILEAAGWVRVVKVPTNSKPTEILRVHPDFRGEGD
jgi:hypothetical protein